MSDKQMPAWLSAIVETAMRPQDEMGHDESWATPTHVIGEEAVQANGDVHSDYAADLVGLLMDEIARLTQRLAVVEAERDLERKDRTAAEFEMLHLRETLAEVVRLCELGIPMSAAVWKGWFERAQAAGGGCDESLRRARPRHVAI
jgi:hypothetical protein